MSTITTHPKQPFSAEDTAAIKEDFFRDGFRFIPDILSSEEVEALKAAVDRVFDDPSRANRYSQDSAPINDIVAVRLFETDPIFEEMLTREPIISLAESILGTNCHLIAQNVVRNGYNEALDGFHADDALFFPVPEGVERHDPRLQMPVYIMTVQIPLTDVPSIEYGPTEYVPGSHYAGRWPSDPQSPTFDGNEPIQMLCKAGDIYLHNGQCWHRGTPNLTQTTRYLFQLSYAVRWVSQRFYPFVLYKLPEHVLANTDERRRRVLGAHPGHGGYG